MRYDDCGKRCIKYHPFSYQSILQIIIYSIFLEN